ncbi:MAG: TIGR01459 family HAD-type hydrolase [Proteobacteria bacterium]|nr:TIGR01459 family HAD-type hydrolase [Pseudomonadota bacterium]
MSFKIIKGLSDIWEDYNGYVVDLWGVIHDGKVLYPDVLRSLEELRTLKKQIVFLSNAPRKSIFIKERLSDLKIDPHLYKGLITSGDDALGAMIETYIPNFGCHAFFIGGEKDRHMLDVPGLKEAISIEKADFILGIHTFSWEDSLEDYMALLEKGLKKNIPFVCVNPDLIVHIQGEELICAGTLADWYESQGGKVFSHGKPHKSVYERALNVLEIENKSKILCIGDSLRTDVTGAVQQGLDVAFIPAGIHKFECLETGKDLPFEKNLRNVFQKHGKVPTYVLPEFKR